MGAQHSPGTSLVPEGLTAAQAAILDKFATIEAELSCLIRETRRTRDIIRDSNPKRHAPDNGGRH